MFLHLWSQKCQNWYTTCNKEYWFFHVMQNKGGREGGRGGRMKNIPLVKDNIITYQIHAVKKGRVPKKIRKLLMAFAMKGRGGFFSSIFIGPKSDHWECLSVTNSITHWLTDSLLFSGLGGCVNAWWCPNTQQPLKAVKSFVRLKKLCKLSTVCKGC